jgi:Asp-tRNA(Asn)/Glu-tRNA(Gln) amidotransferase C subunit
MTAIVDLMDTIKEINIGSAENSIFYSVNDIPSQKPDNLRNDKAAIPIAVDDILKNSAFKLENSFAVPKIVE